MRACAVRLDFATVVTERRGVFFGNKNGLENFVQSSTVACEKLFHRHPRCKTDEAIKKMAATGGVMGITGVRMFVKPDNASLDLDDYPSRGRRALHALRDLAKNGGYVCAEYHDHKECLLGYVSPDSNIELTRGKWGSRNECDGRQAILKTLRLKRVKLVSPSDLAVIFVGRPRQGTIMRWPRAGKTIENSVEGRHPIPAIGDLSPDQQEIMCAEFLRSASAEQFGLPKLAHLLLPVGRTMKGIDICGITDTGTMVFGQVTFANVEHCNHKIQALGQFHEPRRNVLVLFCDCAGPTVIDGIQIVPLQAVYNSFIDTRTGKLWIEKATSLSFK